MRKRALRGCIFAGGTYSSMGLREGGASMKPEPQKQSVEFSQKVLEDMAARGRKSLFFLTRAILGFDKMTKDIHLPICKDLQNLEDEHRRQMIMLPRDWYKTTLASISYPIWRAINNPEIRILLVQNTYTNACSKLAAIKQIFEKNPLFKACYPEILPTKDCKWSKDSWPKPDPHFPNLFSRVFR